MKRRKPTKLKKDTFLIVGNGISIDFAYTFPQFGLNPSNPISSFNNKEKIHLDELFKYVPDIVQNLLTVDNQERVNQFEPIEEYFNNIIDTPEFDEKESQLIRFLMVIYSKFQMEANKFNYSDWLWTDYFYNNSKRIALAVSFNYDLLLENAIRSSGNTYKRLRTNEYDGEVNIFKPHGSIDFDLTNMIHIKDFDPRRDKIYRNNSDRVNIVSPSGWTKPRIQADVIPPNAKNYHIETRNWICKGYEESYNIIKANKIKHVLFIGHSYGEVDRKEINNLIDNITFKANFYFVNPHPVPIALREHIKGIHRHHEIHHINPSNKQDLDKIFTLKKYALN
ncbi:SIR2 family protein [Priestia endophytica]|uniref:SIR2-like domain-containing protein n=1 Tax=Priestia endophytica TaxID=135735 RepID=A0AAX1Q5M3_9BACI|nr:SIR2 family protein [Priestia endophytica]RAS75224.1 hypothetical protein A3864_16290 [Priestia endophytica]